MLRSLYSGVSGMKVHQTRMDVVGNNISNVNTYGFKASRATFSDLYYQTLSSASGASSSKGGTNSSQIGYGVQFGGVDLLMDRAAFTTTGRSLDVAIAGDGFFQVQNSEGNKFYTRAGILNIDTAGNLVDSNGNFVLGVAGSAIGQNADDKKIQLSVPSVTPAAATATEIINGKKFTITSSNKTDNGNVSFNFSSDNTLPGGLKAKAEITTSGISIKLNANEVFYTMSELNEAVNRAITEANGGKTHPAGTFTIATDPAQVFPGSTATKGTVTATPIMARNPSTLAVTAPIFGDVTFSALGAGFTGTGDLTFSADFVAADPTGTGDASLNRWLITATDGRGTEYSGYVVGDTDTQTIKLTNNGSATDYIQVTSDGTDEISTAAALVGGVFTDVTNFVVDDDTKMTGGLEFKSVSSPFSSSGTVGFAAAYVAAVPSTDTTPATSEGWKITATIGTTTFTGIVGVNNTSSGAVRLMNSTGTEYIELTHSGITAMNTAFGATPPVAGTSTLAIASTTTATPAVTFTATASSPFVGTGLTGDEIVSNDFTTQPGVMTGVSEDEGVLGGLQFVTTSSDFSVPDDNAVVTFAAVYDEGLTAGTTEGWKMTATIGTGSDKQVYTGYITTAMTTAGTFLLKNASGEYIEMSHSGIALLNEAAGTDDPSTGAQIDPPTDVITITSAKASNALGLASKDITLEDGTEGGAQSVSDLTNIAIDSTGVITATHSILGTIQLGQIILATFENPSGLEEAGNSCFIETSNSGKAQLARPGESGTGSLVTSSLEMSNVDLSKEFTELITTQRGFQANSRVITVSDTLLEELINLKR